MFSLWIFVFFLGAAQISKSAPIAKHMVDMSYVFDNSTLNWPTVKRFENTLKLNETTSDGYWFQLEEYASSTHVGTHMDAPCHFVQGRWSIDQIPLSHLVAPAAVVDITDKAELNPEAEMQIEDLQKWEEETGQTLNGTIIMMKTGWGRRWSNRTAFMGNPDNDELKLKFPGISPKAAQWLVDNRNIYGLGTETLSIDKGSATKFPVHTILYDANIYGLENVANMEEIPTYGATLYVLPMKIGAGSGAPTRIVATYPKVIFTQKGMKSVTERPLPETIVFN